MRKKPTCLSTSIVARSRLFEIEAMELQFPNGKHRVFERIKGARHASVLIVPMLDEKNFLLIREYGAAAERYELSLPKGLRDPGESILEAANRELKEEVGYGARELTFIKELTASPGYFSASTAVVLARDLYPERLPGDEPEALEVVPWSLDKLPELLAREDVTESRSTTALYMVRDRLLAR